MNLIKINESVSLVRIDAMPYIPNTQCFDWCAVQHMIHSNNLELSGILLIILAYILIVIYGIADEIKLIKPYKETFIYWAKLSLILFFGYYIFIVRMGLFNLA